LEKNQLIALFRSLNSASLVQYLPKATLLFSKTPHKCPLLHNVLLDACINCGQLDQAVSLLISGEGNFDTVSFNTVIKGCAVERKDRIALDIFTFMKTKSCKPNDVTFNTLIDCCVRANKMPRAWALLKEMQNSSLQPDNFTYSTIIKGIKADT